MVSLCQVDSIAVFRLEELRAVFHDQRIFDADEKMCTAGSDAEAIPFLEDVFCFLPCIEIQKSRLDLSTRNIKDLLFSFVIMSSSGEASLDFEKDKVANLFTVGDLNELTSLFGPPLRPNPLPGAGKSVSNDFVHSHGYNGETSLWSRDLAQKTRGSRSGLR
jgi:hypothetical protein